MSKKNIVVMVNYEPDLSVGLHGGTDVIDFGADESNILQDKEEREELKKVLKPVIDFLHPEATWWHLGDECQSCGGIDDDHREHCEFYKVEKNKEEIKKGKLTEVQKEILELIPKGEWFFEYYLARRICESHKNVSSQLRKIYGKGYLERRTSDHPDKMSPWWFDYKVKED